MSKLGYKFMPIDVSNWTKDEYEKIHIIPHTKTRKFLWGLWSHSETETMIFQPSGVYRLDYDKPKTTSAPKSNHKLYKEELK